MVTITSLGGPELRCNFGKIILRIFPEKVGDTLPEGEIYVLAHPEEVPMDGTISWPGEYDFNAVSIRGLGHEQGSQVSFVVVNDGVRLAFLSTPLHGLTDFELEQIGDIDILAIPTDDLKVVQELVDAIDPRVLIPLPTNEKIFQDVLKAFGAVGKEAVEEYKLKASLPTEGREVVILKEGK